MAKTSGIDRRDFVVGVVALGTAASEMAAAATTPAQERAMTTATIDGLEVVYETRGSGPALLMLAPGGFDATMEKWTTAGVWKGPGARAHPRVRPRASRLGPLSGLPPRRRQAA
jgi:hypothetical protein